MLVFLKEARLRGVSFSGAPGESSRIFLRKFDFCSRSSMDRMMALGNLLDGSAERWFYASGVVYLFVGSRS